MSPKRCVFRLLIYSLEQLSTPYLPPRPTPLLLTRLPGHLHIWHTLAGRYRRVFAIQAHQASVRVQVGHAALRSLDSVLSLSSADTPLEKSITYPFAGTSIGAWLGAFVIPLDWDRPWQVGVDRYQLWLPTHAAQSWPLTPTWGSTVGFLIGAWLVWVQSARISVPTETIPLIEKSDQLTGKPKRKAKVKSQ